MTYERKCFFGDEPRIIVTDEFVAKNKLSIDVSVALRLLKDPPEGLGFSKDVCSEFVTLSELLPYLTVDGKKAVKSGEYIHRPIMDVKEAAQDFLDYMVFAWGKAMDERGISAARSVFKLSAWMDILGRPDVGAILRSDDLYEPYGRPALRRACELLGISCPDYL